MEREEKTLNLLLGDTKERGAGSFRFRYRHCYPNVDEAPTITIDGKAMNANYEYTKITNS